MENPNRLGGRLSRRRNADNNLEDVADDATSKDYNPSDPSYSDFGNDGDELIRQFLDSDNRIATITVAKLDGTELEVPIYKSTRVGHVKQKVHANKKDQDAGNHGIHLINKGQKMQDKALIEKALARDEEGNVMPGQKLYAVYNLPTSVSPADIVSVETISQPETRIRPRVYSRSSINWS